MVAGGPPDSRSPPWFWRRRTQSVASFSSLFCAVHLRVVHVAPLPVSGPQTTSDLAELDRYGKWEAVTAKGQPRGQRAPPAQVAPVWVTAPAREFEFKPDRRKAEPPFHKRAASLIFTSPPAEERGEDPRAAPACTLHTAAKPRRSAALALRSGLRRPRRPLPLLSPLLRAALPASPPLHTPPSLPLLLAPAFAAGLGPGFEALERVALRRALRAGV